MVEFIELIGRGVLVFIRMKNELVNKLSYV